MSATAQTLQSRVEVVKLARLLEREPDQLAYLERLAPEDLRVLRDRITEALYDAHAGALGRLASASHLLPTAVVATIAERAFGPHLAALMAARLDPDRAVDVAARLSTPFLTDVAVGLDPRRASEVIARIPATRIAEITAELNRRAEHVAMGRFIGHLPDEAARAAVAQLDGRALLAVGFVIEDKGRLSALLRMMPPARPAAIVAAAAEYDMWLEAIDLLGHLTARQRRQMVGAALELDPSPAEAILAAIVDNDLWNEIVIIAERDPELQQQLVRWIATLPARTRGAAARQAQRSGALERLGVLGEALAAK